MQFCILETFALLDFVPETGLEILIKYPKVAIKDQYLSKFIFKSKAVLNEERKNSLPSYFTVTFLLMMMYLLLLFW